MTEDKQLSFEGQMYEKERELLLILSGLNHYTSLLHFIRTGVTTTIDTSKSKKHIKHLKRVNDGLTGSLNWLADIQYHITRELVEYGTVQEHDKQYFHDKLKGNIVVPGRTSTPYNIYSSYIKCYRDLAGVLNSYPAVLSELPIVTRLTEELYKDLQYVGEELEEIM